MTTRLSKCVGENGGGDGDRMAGGIGGGAAGGGLGGGLGGGDGTKCPQTSRP